MLIRGYVAIGLDRPKCRENLGGVLRAAGCYGAALIMLTGERMGKYQTDTMNTWKKIPCLTVPDLLEAIPFGAEPVVVEIGDRAKPIFDFTHPERAFYIFGPEDGSVSSSIVDKVQRVVSIPTDGCMNLAATVNVILYDRMLKAQQKARARLAA